MERKGSYSNMSSKRPALKGSKGHPPPGDFIALGGSKSIPKSGSDSDLRLASTSRKPSLIAAPGSLKREAVIPGGVSKKPKLQPADIGLFTPLGRRDHERKQSPSRQTPWEEKAKDIVAKNFLHDITSAESQDDDDEVEALLCGSVKNLRQNLSKPESTLYLTLLYLAKEKSSLFQSELVIEAICSLLKRDMTLNFKAKGNALVPVLLCNVLMSAFRDERHWPEQFVKTYVEDSLGERVWVDRGDCRNFVDNIQTAFSTKMPKSSVMLSFEGRPDQSPSTAGFGEDDDSVELMDSDRPIFSIGDDDDSTHVSSRYIGQQVAVEEYVVNKVKEQLSRRQSMDGTSRNLLRLMTASCGYPEVRMLGTQRMEMWLQNPKLSRPAQDLLMAICLNCDQHSKQDVEVMSLLSKMRLKTKPIVNHFLFCIRELLNQNPENMKTFMTQTIYNELSQARGPNNMAVLATMFGHSSENAARILAEIFQELLCNRDDYLRALRPLLREIVKAVRQDMNFYNFASGLMQEINTTKFHELDPTLKDRLFLALTDLVTLTALLSVSPAVKEAASAGLRCDVKDLDTLRVFQVQMAKIQRDAVYWLHTIVPKMFEINPKDFNFSLRKLLISEKPEHYAKIDNWPPESERSLMLRLASEVPVLEDTLICVLIIGLTKELAVKPADALDLADQLIRRASVLYYEGYEVLQVHRVEIFDLLFKLSAYKHPDNIALPKGYQPPSLAISNLYWKSWVMLLVIASYNPSTIGLEAWKKYPTLSCYMEMVMTNNFTFPPPTRASEEKQIEELRAAEKQVGELEKQQILQFESYLAAATNKVTITESNSLLLSQVTLLEPVGFCRHPPPMVLEQLSGLNRSLKLGSMLCKSREPDFLLELIQRQGTSQSMPWLANLVESSSSSLDVLPVQCLCEYLLHHTSSEKGDEEENGTSDSFPSKREQRSKKQAKLLGRLKALIRSPESDVGAVKEVLGYFLKRLNSGQTSQRNLAVKGLSMILAKVPNPKEDDEPMDIDGVESNGRYNWLVNELPSLPHFSELSQQANFILRQACLVETDAWGVSAYIQFLSKNNDGSSLQEMEDIAYSMAQLIVDRPLVINHLIPPDGMGSEDTRANLVLSATAHIFHAYTRKAREPQDGYIWSNTQDQVMLQWESGESATMNILVVHAMIILLTCRTPQGEDENYDGLMNIWFPESGRTPVPYLVDTSEEAQLLPDWLMLKMIRSTNRRLVTAALQGLEPDQLLLFVQSFGVPVASMTQLLGCLDRAVEDNYDSMERAILDKGYMAQLVEAQHLRGASGGEKFQEMLKLHQDETPANDVDMLLPCSELVKNSRQRSKLVKPRGFPPNQLDVNKIQQILLTIFSSDDNEQTMKDRREKHYSLLKCIAQDKKVADKLGRAILKLMNDGKSSGLFLQGFLHFQSMACSLVQILIAKQDRNMEAIATILLKQKTNCKTTLSKILLDYKQAENGNVTNDAIQKQLKQLKSKGGFSKVLLDGEHTKQPYTETMVNSCMAETISQFEKGNHIQQRISEIEQVMARMTMAEDVRRSGDNQRFLPSTAGLLVDWLSLLGPDIVQSSPELMLQLMFARNENESRPASPARSCQPYLLALLTHQSSWRSLQACINLLLEPTTPVARYRASSVLDFLWACLHIPKIWQGRDKKVPKNYTPENVLQLSKEQIIVLVKYILQEAQDLSSDTQTPVHSFTSNAASSLEKRMLLLTLCFCDQGHLIRETVDYLHNELKKDGPDWSLHHHLLLQLYLTAPHITSLVTSESSSFNLLQDVSAVNNGLSQLDSLTHRLIHSLCSPSAGKISETRMYDANISCRSLATKHPLLMLRQLDMCSSLLKGGLQYRLSEMKQNNYLLLYTYAISLIELLQPFIFHPKYEAWTDVIQTYCDLIKMNGLENRVLASLTNKFMELLQNFMAYDSYRAGHILHKHRDLLNALSSHYPDNVTIKSLLAALALPRRGDEEDNSCTDQNNTETGRPVVPGSSRKSNLVPVKASSPWTATQLAPFHNKISKMSSPDDVLEVLKDLDETSKRKVEILDNFVGDLKRLISHPNPPIRTAAHLLVMRHLRQNPSCAADFVRPYLQCFDSPSQEICTSALKNLAEFVVLAQDHSVRILQKVFSIGLGHKVETQSFLLEALQLLNMDTLTMQ